MHEKPGWFYECHNITEAERSEVACALGEAMGCGDWQSGKPCMGCHMDADAILGGLLQASPKETAAVFSKIAEIFNRRIKGI